VPTHLNGLSVLKIHADLTAGIVNLTTARQLPENEAIAFIGTTKKGPFEIPGALAREWLQLPVNPNGRPNSDVLRPWMNGMDITRRPADYWIVDFGSNMELSEATLYEKPFQHVLEKVKPQRDLVRNDMERRKWWLHARGLQEMRAKLSPLKRYIATPRVAKHRLFIWIPGAVLPDCQIVAVARDDDTTFGILHSRFHEAWSLGLCTWLGVGNDPRYTPSTVFGTFPFPQHLTPDIPAADFAANPYAQSIAVAARRLNELRSNWLNPAGSVKIVPEVVSGYPDRLVPVDKSSAEILKKRTLTNLYNEHPAWLINAHRELDQAVAAAYGWPEDISDENALAELFALNQARHITYESADI
jgi:type II restriction/modification system DNA methylase subunit YeeA